MKIFKTALLLSLLSIVLALTSACNPLGWKYPSEYGESMWITDENDLIKIEMYVTDNKEIYSFVTYNEVTKKYKNKFISEMLYFSNIDEEDNLILQDGHITGFSAIIIDASKGKVKCRMDLNEFFNEFLGSDNTEHEDEYLFILTMVLN